MTPDANRTSPRVIAMSFGMTMFFVAAVFGIVCRIDPFVIAMRASVSAAASAAAARVTLLFLDITVRSQRHKF